jgi:hypothetical protein
MIPRHDFPLPIVVSELRRPYALIRYSNQIAESGKAWGIIFVTIKCLAKGYVDVGG